MQINAKFVEQLHPEAVEALAELDAHGFIPGRSESFDQFKSRLGRILAAVEEFEREIGDRGEINVFGGLALRQDDRIAPEIVAEAASLTEQLYRFSIDWAPGFFLSKDIGLLWGGCAIADTEKPLTIFLIRDSFRHRRRWFIYDRRELLAHELCHTARGLRDYKLEEFFAYQTAPSRLRRYLGNCFIKKYDALLFLLPVLLLLAVQMLQTFAGIMFPVWPFWIIALLYPARLLIRNQLARNRFFRARKRLLNFGFGAAAAILFRSTWDETGTIAGMKTRQEFLDFVDSAADHELRWKIIRHRFIVESHLRNFPENVVQETLV